MDHETFQELATSFVIMMTMPYWLGIPVTIIWALFAMAAEWLTGWHGLLPADVWHEINKKAIRNERYFAARPD